MRFKYHFEPQSGWINDPNGLCYYKGQYHAFFQHNPYAPRWDVMHWGHAVSDDLVNWKQLEIALYPDQSYENNEGCYSGSAIEKDGELHLFYTSVSHHFRQTQSTAWSSDGIHFVKSEKNPIIVTSPYCGADGKNENFRDPKVFWAFGKYNMVIGACDGDEGQVLLYSSDDLEFWRYEGIIYASKDLSGTLECPDLFPVGDKWVLLFSAMKPTVVSSVFVVGDFDGKRFIPDSIEYSEFGRDFYAPQTFEDPCGRRIMIGWFYRWGKSLPAGAETAGALSIPRELSIQNGRIVNYPVKEARHLLVNECEYVKLDGTILTIFGINGEKVFEKDLHGINGIEKIEKIDILFDVKAVEVFINGGVLSVSQWLI